MNENLRYDIKIETPTFKVEKTSLTEQELNQEIDTILKENPNDELLKDKIQGIKTKDGFGFCSTMGDGYDVGVSRYMPRVKTGEKQTCGRRMNDFGGQNRTEMLDEWISIGDDKVCSYCGSLHPERVIELIKQHGIGIIARTDKDYKVYIERKDVPNASHGGIKYYMQHNTPEFVSAYNELITNYKN